MDFRNGYGTLEPALDMLKLICIDYTGDTDQHIKITILSVKGRRAIHMGLYIWVGDIHMKWMSYQCLDFFSPDRNPTGHLCGIFNLCSSSWGICTWMARIEIWECRRVPHCKRDNICMLEIEMCTYDLHPPSPRAAKTHSVEPPFFKSKALFHG